MNLSQLAEFDILPNGICNFLIFYVFFHINDPFSPLFFQAETAEMAKTVWNNQQKSWIVKSHFKGFFFVINTESL